MADETTSVVDSIPSNMSAANQYCLKWNNHKINISNVFERLRADSQFCDTTLFSSDNKFVKCHRLLLCAGSGYFEEILRQNPSEHPTIVLSQINYEEIRALVDFMYLGEVSIATDKLATLLEAANVLKIKGLADEPNNEEEAVADSVDKKTEEEVKKEPKDSENKNDEAYAELPRSDSINSPAKATCMTPKGSQKRKRKSVPPPMPTVSMNNPELTTTTSLLTSPICGVITPKSEGSSAKDSSIYSPLFGISNAYFLANTGTGGAPPATLTNAPIATLTPDPTVAGQLNKEKLMSDIPNLLSQTPLHPGLISAIANQTTQTTSPMLASLLPPLVQPSLTMTATTPTPRSSLSSTSPSSDTGGGPSDAKKSKKSSQQKGCPPVTPSDPSGNRKYKQYTEETLHQALKDVEEGQSINRSSVKYNIPARTLRDWMKRMNIKSVFTHNNGTGSVKSDSGSLDSRNPSMESNDAHSVVSNGELSTSPDLQLQVQNGSGPVPSMVVSAFPGMTVPLQVVQESVSHPDMDPEAEDTDEEEEEIDDDEDGITSEPSGLRTE